MISWASVEKKYKLLIFFILLALLIALIFFINEDNRRSLEALLVSVIDSEKELKLVTSINAISPSKMRIYGENIYLFDENKVSSYNMEGRLISENQFSFEDPLVHFGDNYIYIGDRLSGEVYKLDGEGETREDKDFEKSLFSLREEDKATIYHTKTGNVENIYLYDHRDVLIGDHSFEGKNIINYGLHPSASKYVVSLLDLQGNALRSELLFYGENNSLLDSFELEDEILFYGKVLRDDTIISLSDSSLYSIRGGQIVWSRPFTLIKDIYIDEEIYILYSNYLEILDLYGETIDKISFTNDYEKILPFNKGMLVYGRDGLVLLSDGVEKMSYSTQIDLLAANRSHVLILKGEKLDIYRLAFK